MLFCTSMQYTLFGVSISGFLYSLKWWSEMKCQFILNCVIDAFWLLVCWLRAVDFRFDYNLQNGAHDTTEQARKIGGENERKKEFVQIWKLNMRFRVVLFFSVCTLPWTYRNFDIQWETFTRKKWKHTHSATQTTYIKRNIDMYVNKRDWEMQFCIIIFTYDYGCINRELPVVCDII